MSASARSSSTRRAAPAERVRALIRSRVGPGVAEALPSGYQRLGDVLILRLPEAVRPHHPEIGRAWQEVLGVRTVLVRTRGIVGDYRTPSVERIAGASTETEVVEEGIRYRLDAARLMFSHGNRFERARVGRAVRPGEVVIDLFGGIGYLALPALVLGGASRAFIVEKNPVAFAYLVENLALNRVSDRAVPILGDNREVVLPIGAADRVLLGYLPTSRSWLERGLGLLRPSGGVVHVHEVVGASEGPDRIESEVRSRAEGLGWTVRSATARAVKPYGPGRTHAVVDLSVGPQAPA